MIRAVTVLFRYIRALSNTLIGALFIALVRLTKGQMEIVDGALEPIGRLT